MYSIGSDDTDRPANPYMLWMTKSPRRTPYNQPLVSLVKPFVDGLARKLPDRLGD